MVKSNQLQANWDVIYEKFTVHLKAHFSNLDLDGWLTHFANGHSIDINQFELTLVRLRYSLGGDRPSQTTH